jgi:predicted membrane protein DUF2127
MKNSAAKLPLGIKLLVVFFAFGACMCALAILLLLLPGSEIDSIWRLNPDAHSAFQSMGKVAILLMSIVGIACASAAIGLARGVAWGRWLALVILAINLVGDSANAFARHDFRTLIGLPIGGAMMIYLLRKSTSTSKSTNG